VASDHSARLTVWPPPRQVHVTTLLGAALDAHSAVSAPATRCYPADARLDSGNALVIPYAFESLCR
jgi:hypothetical protein